MPEQNDAQNPTEHIGSQPDPTPSRSPKKTEVVPGAHTANHGEENPKADKAKWTDITMAFFTVLLVVVAVAQAFIFYRQWDEMHSGGVDTHTLAEVAKSQADAAKSQAEEAKAQVDKMSESLTKTDKLISEATTQATATNKLATQAQRSADFAQEAIKTSIDAERPWGGRGAIQRSQLHGRADGQAVYQLHKLW